MEVWCICEGTGVMPVSSIYIICPKCQGAGVIQIKGEDMSDVGIVTLGDNNSEEPKDKQSFAYEEYVELQKQYQEVRNTMWELRSEVISTRDVVRGWFQERYEAIGYLDSFEIDLNDINELLDLIKASPLDAAFEGTATIEISFKVNGSDRHDAEETVSSHLYSLDLGDYTNDYEIESIDVNIY
jgi:hypothetical protein